MSALREGVSEDGGVWEDDVCGVLWLVCVWGDGVGGGGACVVGGGERGPQEGKSEGLLARSLASDHEMPSLGTITWDLAIFRFKLASRYL